ncbi:hypothetical protein ABEB36_004440 [Hypothenemus hampei]|uniref:Uncharacterized protein n=1 Tax=Hypothenemus hampei TaxID=57062 RepID=A0ABD1F3Y5_HYPHA
MKLSLSRNINRKYQWIVMDFLKWTFQNNNYKVFLVALVNSVLLAYGLFLTIKDMLLQQFPVTFYEITYVVLYYLIHAALIVLLLIGTKRKKPYFYIPWLIVFLVVFSAATYYWIQSLFNGNSKYLAPTAENILVLGLCWSCWYTIVKDFFVLKTFQTFYFNL